MNTKDQQQKKDAQAPADAPACLAGLRPAATTAAYLLPPAIAAASVGVMTIAGAGACEITAAKLALGGGVLLVGLAAGALAGRAASKAERRAVTREYERHLDDLDHDLRTPMTIVRGEVELVLSQEDTPVTERGRSSAAIIEQLEKLESLLLRRYRT
jgi:signal transduction histidine kinase